MLPNALFLNVHMYGIMIAVGILFAFLVLFRYSKVLKLPNKLVDLVYYDGVVSILLGFGSASLFQSFFNYLENPEGGFHFGEGITFLGGMIGGTVVYVVIWLIFRKKVTGSLFDIMPVIPCMITVGHAFGRIGCFFAGCCYGKASGDSIFGVKFPDLSYKVYPTQLFEAVFLFILFGVLTWLLLRKKFQYTMSVYLWGYGVFRFCLEFLRDDDRGKLFGHLTPSQGLAIVYIGLGFLAFFLLKNYFKRKKDEPVTEEIAEESAGKSEEKTEEKPILRTVVCMNCGKKFELFGTSGRCPFCDADFNSDEK